MLCLPFHICHPTQEIMENEHMMMLLPDVVARCCCQMLLPDVVARCCCLDVVAQCCCPMLLPNVVARCCCQMLLPNSINCRLCCEWRPAWSSVNESSIQSRLTFVTVSTGFQSVQESISSWVSSFTSVSRAPLLDTSWRCLCRNQLFQPFLAFARWRKVTFLCQEQKQKTIGPRSFATSGPALWNNLPDDLRDPSLSLTVFKQRLFKQC